MNTASFLTEVTYLDNKPNIQLILESEFSKEIRISFRKNQTMAEHQTKFPITVQVLQGRLDFGVPGKIMELAAGDMISLPGSIPHDLKAIEDSVVRLTLSKTDLVSRVEKVVA